MGDYGIYRDTEAVEISNQMSIYGGPKAPPHGMSYTEWLPKRRDLAVKKNKIRAEISRVAKNGVNDEQGYNYAEAADVYDAVRPLLDKHNLWFDVEPIGRTVTHARNSAAPITQVKMLVTWMDLETGYFEEKIIDGDGMDWGDKGIYKGYTGATKYALILEFLIPTGGNDPMPGPGDAEGSKKTPAPELTAEPIEGGKVVTAKAATPARSRAAAKEKEPAQDGPAPDAITAAQIGAIKLKIGQLAEGKGNTAEKRGKELNALYMSVGAKLRMPSLEGEKDLVNLTSAQAEKALLDIDAWLASKEQLTERNKLQEANTHVE